MPTSTPLVYYAPPPPARKPALKRRRLNHGTDSGYQPGRALTDNSNVGPTPNNNASCVAKLSCSTCHRALSTVIRPGVAGPSLCSRCAAPTCAICARTCTSYTCPPSLPPTPALTRSPSPSTQPASPVSPKRAPLGLGCAAMNCGPSLALPSPPSSIKRKKAPIEKEDGDGGRQDGGVGGVRDGSESVVVAGCGRVVCRACCVESVINDGKLCVDCIALV